MTHPAVVFRTVERTFAFWGQHLIEYSEKRPKKKSSYLRKLRNLIEVQLKRDEEASRNGADNYAQLIGPQSELMRKYLNGRANP